MLLAIKVDHFICSSGYLEYSVHLTQRMTELFVTKSSEVRMGIFSGDRFCPQCGNKLHKYTCTLCGINILPINFELIEHHPHGTPEGRFI